MSKPTTVSRAPKPKNGANFARILNATLQDARLSFRARGVLAFVLSKPTDWIHSAEKLSSLSPDGEDAVKSALRELATLLYLDRRTVRDQSGKLRTTLHFSEEPKAKNPPSVEGENRQGQNRQSVNRPPGQPPPGQPTAGKAPSLETTVRNDGVETKERNHSQETGEDDSMVSLIWGAYPRKQSEKPAREAITAAIARISAKHEAPGDWILERTKAYAAAVELWPASEKRFIPHPAKWFTDENYSDDPTTWHRHGKTGNNRTGQMTEADHAGGF